MNSSPLNQIQLYGLKNEFKELTNLYSTGNFPNKILLSGQKGCGKCTLAYHLINYVLSMNEDYSYDSENLKINDFSDLDILSKILNNKGDVEVLFEFSENNKKYTFKLKNKRFVDKNILNSIKNQGISTSIF